MQDIEMELHLSKLSNADPQGDLLILIQRRLTIHNILWECIRIAIEGWYGDYLPNIYPQNWQKPQR